MRSYLAAIFALCCSASIVMAKGIVGTAKDAGQFAMLLKAA
ncbi:MAG: hypothetical protein ABIO35_04080 [Nitrobacter sp.]